MQKISINNKVYAIPQSWGEMTFEQFLKLSQYLKSMSDVTEEDEYSDDIFYSNILACLHNVPKDSYMNLSILDSKIFRDNMAFLSTKFTNEPFAKTITYQNLVFKIKNYDGLKFGEYIDMLHLSSNSNELNLITLVALMSDVYVKKDIKKFKFRDKKIDFTQKEKEDIIKKFPATKANSIITFFLHGQKQSQKNIASSLNKMAFRLVMRGRFRKAGLIIYGLWMHVVRMLLSLMMLLIFRFDKSSRIWHTKIPRII